MHAALILIAVVLSAEPRSDPYFRIKVVDELTGRGVPLMELRTVNDLTYYTDSAGVVAFHEPGWMDQTVFFHVRGHGYELAPDGFGIRGRRLTTETGGSAEIQVRRINVAERLYRITGSGLYVDSERVGLEAPLKAGSMNAQVVGSDSVQAALFHGRIHWFWGDTNRPSYPLGNFHAPGATSHLPADGGLDPTVGVALNYFVGPDGFAKPTCKMPGEGPTWIDGLAVVKDAEHRERLFAHYLKVKPPLTVYQHGLAEFDSEQREFVPRAVFPADAVVIPSGHSFKLADAGVDYVYFAKPLSVVRCRAVAESILDPDQYEAYSCLTVGSRAEDARVDRDADGQVHYGWKRGTAPMTLELQDRLLKSGQLKSHECLFQVRDVETNKPVRLHHGSLNWNPFLRRWLLIATESSGTSALGEVWYAEADSPLGPWAYARKIVTHDKQSFYNPRHHPFFNQQNGRTIFFEGTYTHTFSGNHERTPRYEYNQIMYRLDLGDSRLTLPAAVYRRRGEFGDRLEFAGETTTDPTFREVAFFAYRQPVAEAHPIYGAGQGQDGVRLSRTPVAGNTAPLFYVLPVDAKVIPAGCVRLFEFARSDGVGKYGAEGNEWPEYRRADQALGRVWPVPKP